MKKPYSLHCRRAGLALNTPKQSKVVNNSKEDILCGYAFWSETEWQVLKQGDRFWNRVTGSEIEWQVLKQSDRFWNKVTGCETEWQVLKQSNRFWNRVTVYSKLGFVYGLRLRREKYPRIFCYQNLLFQEGSKLRPKVATTLSRTNKERPTIMQASEHITCNHIFCDHTQLFKFGSTLVISMWKHSL